MVRIITGVFILLCPLLVNAHGEVDHEASKLQIGASFNLNTYSHNTGDENGYWRIPGLLMGGEALPIEKGVSLDEAQLWGRYRFNDAISANVSVSHHHGSTELEGLNIRYKGAADRSPTVSVGLMGANFSPSISHHANMQGLTGSSLLTDAFWGGGFHDTGFSLNWKPIQSLELGLDIWEGDFPGTTGEGMQDISLKFNRSISGWDINSGVWAARADAENRGDARYNGEGHSHSNTSLATEPVDVRFSGSTRLTGAWFDIQSPEFGPNNMRAELKYEATQVRAVGELFDDTRLADYSSDHLAYSITPSLHMGDFQLLYRSERLSLENNISGAAAQTLAEEANLITAANPQRQSVQLRWQAKHNLSLQAGYTKDQTLDEDDKHYYSIGLLWQDELYRR